MERVFEATIEKHGKWWIGWVDAVPGANSQGRTIKEVQENLKEAVAMVLAANKELLAMSPVKHYPFTFRQKVQIYFFQHNALTNEKSSLDANHSLSELCLMLTAT